MAATFLTSRQIVNSRVCQTYSRDTVAKSVRDTLPRVYDVRDTPVHPSGSLVYDLRTDTIYYSNGLIWQPLCCAADIIVNFEYVCPPKGLVAIEPSNVLPPDEYPDVSIVLEPRGTGALMTDIPDGTAVGGNCRGDYSSDFQIVRSAATSIVSGSRSFIGSGSNNQVSGNDSFVGSGIDNTATLDMIFIGTGIDNTAVGSYTFIATGSNTGNTLDFGEDSGIVTGINNSIFDDGVVVSGQNCRSYFTGFICSGDTNTSGGFVGSGINCVAIDIGSVVGTGNLNGASADTVICSGILNLGDIPTTDLCFIGTGSSHIVSRDLAIIGAGVNNSCSNISVVGAGDNNTISNAGTDTCNVICAGINNEISGGSTETIIGAGSSNTISNSNQAGIIAGSNNDVISSANNCFVGAGRNNVCTTGDWSCVVSGNGNTVTALNSFIGSGSNNSITANAIRSGICAGSGNITDGARSIICAGINNNIATLSTDSCIMAGSDNNLTTSATTMICAGINNLVTATSGIVFAGQRNTVTHTSSTIISGTDLSSTVVNRAYAQDIEYRSLAIDDTGGATSRIGLTTLVLGGSTIATQNLAATDTIHIYNSAVGGVPGALFISARVNGAPGSFTISSTNLADTSTVAYVIIGVA